jgi:hypothetical protein
VALTPHLHFFLSQKIIDMKTRMERLSSYRTQIVWVFSGAISGWSIVAGIFRLGISDKEFWGLLYILIGITSQLIGIQLQTLWRARNEEEERKEIQKFHERSLRDLLENTTNKRSVWNDGPDALVWRGFSGHYRAYNPTFGMDVRLEHGVKVFPQRVLAHADRYKIGKTQSWYYLHSGAVPDTTEAAELTIIRKFLILMWAVECSLDGLRDPSPFNIRNPAFRHLESSVNVCIVDGPRSVFSVFIGFKETGFRLKQDEEFNFGISYVTDLPFEARQRKMIPRVLTISMGRQDVGQLNEFFGALPASPPQKLNAFCKSVADRIGDTIPPAEAWDVGQQPRSLAQLETTDTNNP